MYCNKKRFTLLNRVFKFLSLFDPVQNLNAKLTVITIVGDQLPVGSVYFIQLLNGVLHEPFMSFGIKQTDMNFLSELLFGTKKYLYMLLSFS